MTFDPRDMGCDRLRRCHGETDLEKLAAGVEVGPPLVRVLATQCGLRSPW